MIIKYKGLVPKIHPSVFLAGNTVISGDVKIGENSGIWFGTVIRGDVSTVRIGKNTNIQDNSVVHVTRAHHKQNKTGDAGGPVVIGDNVTIGHSCIIHACIIEDEAFIGMGSVLMDLARVEKQGMLAAGSVLTPGKVVKSGQLWAGVPAKYFRDMTKEELDYIKISADNYAELAREYLEESEVVK